MVLSYQIRVWDEECYEYVVIYALIRLPNLYEYLATLFIPWSKPLLRFVQFSLKTPGLSLLKPFWDASTLLRVRMV